MKVREVTMLMVVDEAETTDLERAMLNCVEGAASAKILSSNLRDATFDEEQILDAVYSEDDDDFDDEDDQDDSWLDDDEDDSEFEDEEDDDEF